MKTIIISIPAMLFILACLNVNAGDNKVITENNNCGAPFSITAFNKKDKDKMLKSGFFFHMGVFIPFKNYMFPDVLSDIDSSETFGIGPDFELGNMFKIKSFDQQAFGLRATWLSAGLTKLMFDDTSGLRAFNGTIARVGPYFTYSNNDIAFDVFYQIGPSYGIVLDEKWNDFGFDGALGLTHELGLTFRYKVLSLGTGLRFGKIKDVDNLNQKINKEWYLYRTGNIRFFVGIKI